MSALSKFYDIPPEIRYHILTYVEASSCLLSCALICKAWLPLVQERLLFKVNLTRNNIYKFNMLAMKFPHVFTKIRELTFARAEGEASCPLEVIDSLSMLTQQNQVETLRICHANLSRSLFGVKLPYAMLHGFKRVVDSFSSLRNLECFSVSFCSFVQLVDLICASPTLASLDISFCRYEQRRKDTSLPLKSCPRLQTVIIRLGRAAVSHQHELGWQLCNWMARQQPPLPLRTLKVLLDGANASTDQHTQLDSSASKLAATAPDTLHEFRSMEFIICNAVDGEGITRASPLFDLSQNTQLCKLRFDSVKLIATRHSSLDIGNTTGPYIEIEASLSLLLSSLRSTVLEEIDITMHGRLPIERWDWEVVDELLADAKFSKLRLLTIRIDDEGEYSDSLAETFRDWMPRAYAKGILQIIVGRKE